jgi:PIN domain nuclease of toxin-antitoxin system
LKGATQVSKAPAKNRLPSSPIRLLNSILRRATESTQSFLDQGIIQNGFLILPIETRHAVALTTLPFHHRDLFDRLIIAQAIIEQIPVISADTSFDDYPVKRLW